MSITKYQDIESMIVEIREKAAIDSEAAKIHNAGAYNKEKDIKWSTKDTNEH